MNVADGVVAVAAILNGKLLAVGLRILEELHLCALVRAVPGHVHNIARVAVCGDLVNAVIQNAVRNERPGLGAAGVAGVALHILAVRRCAAALTVDVQAVALADEAVGAVGVRDDKELVVLAGAVLPLDDVCAVGRAAAGNVEILIRMQEANRIIAVAAVLDGDRMANRPHLDVRAVFGAVADDVQAEAGIGGRADVIHAVSQRVRDGQAPLLRGGLVAGEALNVVSLGGGGVGQVEVEAALGSEIDVSVSGILQPPVLCVAVAARLVLLHVRAGSAAAAVKIEHFVGVDVADGIIPVALRTEDKLLRGLVAVGADLNVRAVFRAAVCNGNQRSVVHRGGNRIDAVVDGEILRLRSRVGRRHVDVLDAILGFREEISHFLPSAARHGNLAAAVVVAFVGPDIVGVAARECEAMRPAVNARVAADMSARLDFAAEDALQVVNGNRIGGNITDGVIIAVAIGDFGEIHNAEAAPEDVPCKAAALPTVGIHGSAVIGIITAASIVRAGAGITGRRTRGAIGIFRERQRDVADTNRMAIAPVHLLRAIRQGLFIGVQSLDRAVRKIDKEGCLFLLDRFIDVGLLGSIVHRIVGTEGQLILAVSINADRISTIIEQLRLAAAERQTVNAAVGEVVEHVLGDHELIDPAGNALDLAALERRDRVGAERRAVDGVARDQKHIVAHGDGACVRDAGQLGSALEEVDKLNRSVVVDAEAVLAIVDQLAAADRGGEIGRNGFPRLLGQGGILNCRGKGRECQQHCDRKQHGKSSFVDHCVYPLSSEFLTGKNGKLTTVS